MNDKMNELQAYALRDIVQGLLKLKPVTTVDIFGKAAEPAVQAIQESLDASVPALVDTLGWALHELSLLKRRAETAEADARDVRAWADAVPVEAIRRVHKSSHTADAAAERKVRQWLEKQVQP